MKRILLASLFILTTHIATAQLADAGFENWTTDTLGNNWLVSWKHYSGPDTFSSNYLFGTWRTDTSTAGNYALRLSRWYNYTCDWVQQRAPITSRPDALTGFYSYTDNILSQGQTDTAYIEIALTKWNNTTSTTDTIGFGYVHLNAASGFTSFSCPVIYNNNETPDSIIVSLRPMPWYGTTANNTGWGSYLTVDALALAYTTSVPEAKMLQVKIYPNPATDKIHISAPITLPYQLQLSDITGKLLSATSVNASNYTFDISRLSPGNYILKAIDIHGNTQTLKLTKD